MPTSVKMVLACENEILKGLQQVMDREATHISEDAPSELTPEELNMTKDMRMACLHYIRSTHTYFRTSTETFAVAVHMLDTVLWKFKVTERFMSIIGVSCYVIAAKLVEEDEHIPTHHQLASVPGHEWTSRDLCRMELYILQKLAWNPPRSTYLSYLPLLGQLFNINQNVLLSSSTVLLAERCLRATSTVVLSPSTLALSLVLRLSGNSDDDVTKETVKNVIKTCNIDESKLASCSKQLASMSSSILASICFKGIRSRTVFLRKNFSKPSEAGSPELATIMEEMVAAEC